ncbi:MAG: DUF5605 domain-containing protein [Gemmatimonadetes bacterium]|jgi:hypothetical protein|nr:DUF5605 domain-containing protein [Gemmatimonadota bacterium]
MDVTAERKVEQWGIFEATFAMPESGSGSPFVDVSLGATFRYKNREISVDGFYDGEGVFRIRFMPDEIGAWSYVTHSNQDTLNDRVGRLECVAASEGNHGPVRVANTYHFQYADGTPYRQVGTTCYAWNHQGDEMEEQTLASLGGSPFNKIRMCVFPKHYSYSKNEPEYHAFEGSVEEGWDFTRFNPPYFQHLETRIGQLRDLGIEADLILFHPYDRWGYQSMDAETDDRYLKYIVARLAAYRNVWWSFANEYDLMKSKTMADWDRFFRIVQEHDPVQHLRSNHNCREFYDHGKPWVTHASIQSSHLSKVDEWRGLYRKPVVIDECCYEGDIHQDWGNITAQEMVHRFWEGSCRGGYVGHGETYNHPEDILWWSRGGVLHGQSPERIDFLRGILESAPGGGLTPLRLVGTCAGVPGEYYLAYFGFRQPVEKRFTLPDDASYRIEVIDTWEMTIDQLDGTYSGKVEVPLPGKPYTAIRITKMK